VFFKLTNFKRIYLKIEETSTLGNSSRNMIELLKLLCMILIIVHMLACIWISVPKIYIPKMYESWM